MVIYIKITEIFGLNAQQKEIDFINVDTEFDTKVFIEPFHLKHSKLFSQSKGAYSKVETFFEYVYTLYSYGEKKNAFNLLRYSKEIHGLHIGYAHGSKGRGVTDEALDNVFSAITKDPLIAKDMLTNPSTFVILVPNFAEDRMSDLIASIIKKEIVEYTLEQARIHNFTIDFTKHNYGFYWDEETLEWEELLDYSIKDEKGEVILLLPKDIVANKYSYSATDLMHKIIFPVLKEEHLQLNSPLIRHQEDSSGRLVAVKPTNEMLYDYEVRGSFTKNMVKSFTLMKVLKAPQYYFHYVDKIKEKRVIINLTDEELEDLTK